jgi:S1-C subfamily serine protease
MTLDRFTTTTNVYGSNVSKWPAVIWGPVLQQDLLAELQGEFQSAVPVPFGGTDSTADLHAVVSANWLNLASTPDAKGTRLLTVRVTFYSTQTKRALRVYTDSKVIVLHSVENEDVGQTVLNGIETLTHNFGRQIAQDDQLRDGVTMGYYLGASQSVASGPSPYDSAMNAVVEVSRDQNMASGFLVSADGLVVTSINAIGHQTTVQVKSRSGAHYSATVVARDDTRGLALIKIGGATMNFSSLSLSSAVTPSVGHDAVGIFVAGGVSWSATKGSLGGIRQLRVAQVVEFTPELDGGGGDGPVIDPDSGKVIGMIIFHNNTSSFSVLAAEIRKAFGDKIAP